MKLRNRRRDPADLRRIGEQLGDRLFEVLERLPERLDRVARLHEPLVRHRPDQRRKLRLVRGGFAGEPLDDRANEPAQKVGPVERLPKPVQVVGHAAREDGTLVRRRGTGVSSALRRETG